jgi:uncharacterized protein
MMLRTRGAKRMALALALAAALLATGCTTKIVAVPANSSLNTVTSGGSGTVSATPDQAIMSFGVSAQNANAKTALDTVSSEAAKVTAAVKGAGVADKDIQTANVSVYPQYDSSGKKVTGYQASLSVQVTVRDLGSLSKVIDAASSAGSDSISGPTFSISEDSAYQDQATAKAVDDARRSAEAMAKAAGKQLGGVVSITSSNASPVVPLFSGHALAPTAGAASVPVQPGQLDITSNVTVVFELL